MLFFFSIALSAQKKYTVEQLRAAYEGTWKYENASTKECFILKLTYKPYIAPNGNLICKLYGFYSYSVNGKELVNNLSDTTKIARYVYSNEFDIHTTWLIPISSVIHKTGGEGAFSFMDKLLDCKPFDFFVVKAAKIDKTNNVLYWDMNKKDPTAKTIWPEFEPTAAEYPEGCSIPMKMTLTRVK